MPRPEAEATGSRPARGPPPCAPGCISTGSGGGAGAGPEAGRAGGARRLKCARPSARAGARAAGRMLARARDVRGARAAAGGLRAAAGEDLPDGRVEQRAEPSREERRGRHARPPLSRPAAPPPAAGVGDHPAERPPGAGHLGPGWA